MKITVEACGMTCDLLIRSHELGLELIVSHGELANRKIISYTQLEGCDFPIILHEIYHGVKMIERHIKND